MGTSLVIVEKMRTMVEYLPDSSVDDALDEEIRGLLTTCFTKPEDVVFKEQRYFFEPYSHRWVIRAGQGYMVAHTGVHKKEIESQGTTYRIGGLAEVCVHPDYRGQGYVRDMLQCIHEWLQHHDFPFAMLFGDPAVYVSSGYCSIDNLVHGGDQEGWQKTPGMMKELSGTPWPTGEVRLPGPLF